MSRKAGARNAKARLSALLAEMRRGETVTIIDRGRPIGHVVPIDPDRADLASRIERLEAMGWIGRAARKGRRLPAPIRLPERDVAQRLLREGRRRGS